MKKILIILSLFFIASQTAFSHWGFSFYEPPWKEMIKKSAMIAKV